MATEVETPNNWLIVGLGNPGTEYERTRHNLGFMLVDRFAADARTLIKREECRSLVGRADIDGRIVELAKPQTYMNLSGEAVSCLLSKAGRSIDKLIVISDDLALSFGTIRIRTKGSHGGQNGLRNIIDCLRTQEFTRLRIGIAPDHPVAQAKNFVLDRFSKTEAEEVEKILELSTDAVRTIMTEGADQAMAKFN